MIRSKNGLRIDILAQL